MCLSGFIKKVKLKKKKNRNTFRRYQISPDTQTVTHRMHLITEHNGNEYKIRIIKKKYSEID